MSCCGAFGIDLNAMAQENPRHAPRSRHPMNRNSPPSRSLWPREITGRFVLVSLILFFLVVAGVNVVMMTLAIQTMPGTDVRNSYEASQRFNHDIAAARAQDARGWKAEATLRLSGEGAALAIDLRDEKGAPLPALDVSARLIHPATHALDHKATLRDAGAGRYAAEFAGVGEGAWDLVIEAARNGERLYASRNRVLLKP